MPSQVTPPQARLPRSDVVVPHRPKWHGEIAAAGIWLLASTLARTWRLTIRDESGLAPHEHGPFIAALWHNRLAVAMPVWKWWKNRHPSAGLAALISASRDGALLARTFSHFGVKPVRGSSSRRGAQALLELNSALKNNLHVAITPDGPRGPKYVAQPGIISLAQLTGAPIIPVGIFIHRKKQLTSWDQFQIPFPFTRCDACMGQVLRVSQNATADALEEARRTLEATLTRLNPD
ncbi:MAG TPA: lysophospholipid acyltransferase family protein [Verrucomicrobiae bacterium]|nr:lysophospholipid acyltransferase family protein [Verrucomicrobiae bacterium]